MTKARKSSLNRQIPEEEGQIREEQVEGADPTKPLRKQGESNCRKYELNT